jgi:four helix bundle protein
VFVCLLEAYRKKRYPAHFVSKVSDSDMENSETLGWLVFALACNYMSKESHGKYILRNSEIGRLLYHMMSNPDKYCFAYC